MSIEDGPGDTLSPSEGLDSDEVRNDDGDEVVDPPEGWSGADRFGTTQREEQEGESLDQRLAEEEPDVAPPEPLERPVAAMPDDELTEDIVDEVYDGGGDTAVYDGGGDTAVIDGGRKHAELVEGVIVEDSRVDRGQIGGSPEDGESLFPVVE
ncbi:hypothetical protein QLG13_24045 [Rhodococcus aetherivorans]|uniref:hypothetical protein n=1 Tax=Rhodococcus TaxID=1827 RepID=UPI000C9CC25A|nr:MULTISPECIES: hypothetical protein [Rhodococcus]PND52747.1 hypothetical protein CQZ88_06990 [Rhodococcus sp. ENV425]USC14709.1 hypothetical protein KZJ41_24375 [Rhodococcus sp. 11-3]WKW98055.1 hypothetical protein Q3O43_24035 [Rhodococcus aetherivorans]